MKKIVAALALATVLAATAVATAQSAGIPAKSAVPVRNFDVFVDPPTGYTFVKLPSGWKFVGKIEKDDLAHLPATVLTSLLPSDAEGIERTEAVAATAENTR